MTDEETIKILKEQQNEYNEHWVDYAGVNEAYNTVIQIVKQLSSLESEYNAYHTNSDYWEGVKHAIDVLNYKN